MKHSVDNKKIKVPNLEDLSHALNKMQEMGYTENYRATERGTLKSLETSKEYGKEDITITNFFRFEGISDPEDNSILYVIEMRDGTKGTISDAYGAYADPLTNEVLRDVKRIDHE
jgi:hypothetical protein